MGQAIPTICRMCSSRGCGMRVWVEGEKIVKVEGNPNHPINFGGLCPKGLVAMELEYSNKRLLHPLKRKGNRGEGQWEQISLDEAIETTARRLAETKEANGAKSVAYYRGAAQGWDSPWDYVQRFMHLFGSPNMVSHSNVCYVPGMLAAAAVYGPRTQPDYENTDLIILWGFNPGNTTPSYARRILDAKERGATIIVIDTRFSEIASKADRVIRPRPGTDGALALGMMHLIINEQLYDRTFVDHWTVGFDELRELVQKYSPERAEAITGIPSKEIIYLAQTYSTTKCACIEDGNAFDQHTNAVQSIRSVNILRALTGHLGVAGGEIFIPRLPFRDMTLKEKLPKDVRSITRHALYTNIIYVSTPDFIESVLTERPYPVKAMMVQSGCPMMSTAGTDKAKEALQKLDFLVVHDLFLTATAELADIVIPAATFLEVTSLYKYGTRRPDAYSNLVGLQRQVVAPPADCISDEDLRIRLARAMGLKEYFPWNDVKEAIEEEIKPLGISYKELELKGFYQVKYPEENLHKSYETTGFATPSGKVEFYSSTYQEYGYDPIPDYKEPAESPISTPETFQDFPFFGEAGTKRSLWTHSQFRTIPSLKKIQAEPFVEIHPDAARTLGVEEGDHVIVESPRGKIKVRATVTEKMRPDSVSITPGWGQPYSHYFGNLANLLTDTSHSCPVSAALPIRSFLCRIKKA